MTPDQKLAERTRIERELQVLIPAAERDTQKFARDYAAIGDRFLKIKTELLNHGEWLPWLKRNGFRARQPQQYMQAAQGLVSIPSIRQRMETSPTMTLQTLLRLVRAGQQEIKRQERQDALNQAKQNQTPTGLVLGDSLEWMRSQPDQSFRHVVSDPPYGIGVAYDGWTEPDNPEDYWRWFQPFWEEMKRITHPRGSIILYQTHHYLPYLSGWFPNSKIIAECFTGRKGKSWQPVIVWNQPGRKPFKTLNGGNSWLMGGARESAFPGHPCAKPIESARRVIEELTDCIGTILDPFAGTGTIPLICKKKVSPLLVWKGMLAITQLVKPASMRTEFVFVTGITDSSVICTNI